MSARAKEIIRNQVMRFADPADMDVGNWDICTDNILKALDEKGFAIVPKEPTEAISLEPECPFCGRNPYHYVDNGVGMEAVAITCCDEYALVCSDAPDDREIEMTIGDLRTISGKLHKAKAMRAARDEVSRDK